MAKKKAVAKRSSTEMTNWREQLAVYAQEEAEREVPGAGNMISIRGGVFKYQGAESDEIQCIVVDHVFINQWFDAPFQPDALNVPACFSISEGGKDMEPHEDSPVVQNEDCDTCWANEFGTDDRGRGKACSNRRLLAVLTLDSLQEEDPEIALLGVPPASTGNWASYVSKRARLEGLPPLAYVTRMHFTEDEEYPKIRFEEVSRVPDEYIPGLIEKRQEVRSLLLTPPDISQYKSPAPRKQHGKKKVTKKKGPNKSKFAK